MALEIEIEEVAGSSVWVSMAARLTNETGDPVSAAAANMRSEAIAGTYTLTFSDVVPAVSATLFIQTSSPDNPFRNLNGIPVDLDDATIYTNLIGGVDLRFSDDAGFLDTWQAEIRIGHSFGVLPAFGASAGAGTSARKIRVRNTGPEPARNVRARIVRRAKAHPITGKIFERAFDFARGATEKLTGEQVQPYAITVANVSGAGASKTMDLLVDGYQVQVLNLETEVESPSSGLNVQDRYRVVSGGLVDFEFELSESAEESGEANVLIFNARFTQIASDLGGAPGDWGIADIFITEDGEEEGTVTAGGVGFLHVRALVPEGSVSRSNPYILDVELAAEESSPAGWSSLPEESSPGEESASGS